MEIWTTLVNPFCFIPYECLQQNTDNYQNPAYYKTWSNVLHENCLSWHQNWNKYAYIHASKGGLLNVCMFHVYSNIWKITCAKSNQVFDLFPDKGTLFKAFTGLCIVDARSVSFCIAVVLSYCWQCSLCAICFMTCRTLMATWTCRQGKVWDIALVQPGCKSAPFLLSSLCQQFTLMNRLCQININIVWCQTELLCGYVP